MSLLFMCFPANEPAGANRRLYDGYLEPATVHKNKHMGVTIERDYISTSYAHLEGVEIYELKGSRHDVHCLYQLVLQQR